VRPPPVSTTLDREGIPRIQPVEDKGGGAMTIDVSVERVIPLPPEQVAEYAMDWRHDAECTQGIRTAELTREADEGGFGVGAEITRTARATSNSGSSHGRGAHPGVRRSLLSAPVSELMGAGAAQPAPGVQQQSGVLGQPVQRNGVVVLHQNREVCVRGGSQGVDGPLHGFAAGDQASTYGS
jgi:hypothetical protein